MFGKKNSPKIVRSTDESFETIIGQSTEIHVQRLIVGGRINGNVFVSQSVELHDSAHIYGDITYSQITIELGAKMNGRMVTQANAQQGELTTEGHPTLLQSASNQALSAPASD